MLLVEQPGAWGRAGLAQSGFDAGIARALEARAGSLGVRVLAIRRPGRTPRGIQRRWAYADTRDGRQVLRWGSYTRDAELTDVPLDGKAGELDDAPLYLVCAHSKHDACCALRGRPVASALASVRPGRVWECSHLGGERFAANVLLLPGGLLYGRVLPFAAPEFVAAAESGNVVASLLRGRVGLAPAAQSALVFAYEHLAVRERDAVRVLRATPVADGRAIVDLDAPHGRIRVTLVAERVDATGLTCSNPRPNAYLTFRPEKVTALP